MRLGPTPHGTYNGYTNYRCRCTDCREANNAFERLRKMRRKLKPDPELERRNEDYMRQRLELWRAVVEAGGGEAVCEEIVRNRPVPVRLLVDLGARVAA